MTEYVQRQDEHRIEELVESVRSDGKSRIVLLYGDGGVGKTRLVRALADRHGADGGTAWLPPIDLDNPKYWLMSNLESFVCDELDPDQVRFISYYDAELNVYRFAGPYVGTETMLTHIGRMRREFVRCYRSFVEQTGIVVVLTLDTVETIRGMDLLRTVIEAIKSLPRTLLVLSGRPPLAGEQGDPLVHWLDRSSDPMRPITVRMGGFTSQEAEKFLEISAASNLLNDDERSRLARLTGGSPLWLELAVEYLTAVDRPAILTQPEPAELDRVLPPGAAPTKEGEWLREEFKGILVSRYQTLDYWSEAVRRLAVLRYSIDAQVWTRLTADLTWPPGIASPESVWQALLEQPWVRPRANNTLATLHDALAEELAQRVIPWHDHDGSWRRRLWAAAADSYAERVKEPDKPRDELEELTELLRAPVEPGRNVSAEIAQVRQLDTQIRAGDQFNTAWLHYKLLADPDAGTDLFLSMYEQAVGRHDIIFRELICHEIERFLPIGHATRPSPDALDMAVADFHRWLAADGRQKHTQIILAVARFLTDIEQPESAMELLTALPEPPSEPLLRYRQYNALGNTSMRLRGRTAEAEEHFEQALRSARELPATERERCIAQAHKELGYYYRNMGNWTAADDQYRQARQALLDISVPGSKTEYRSEIASIQTNWAYVKALQGNYEDARNLVDSAIDIRQRIGHMPGLGLSHSVSGEVYRYQGKYRRAWRAYAQAEDTFETSHSWPLLGLLYQQQAICLHQASEEGMVILDRKANQRVRAEELITRAITICRDQGVRSYPSALNRAGRIFGSRDLARGLDYLTQAIAEANRIADGWFVSASLIEYLELSYRAWQANHEQRYRDAINERIPEIEEAIANYQFNDLPGRWALLQGHLAVETALAEGRYTGLDPALDHYMTGFITLAGGHVGSHGRTAISGEFATFQQLYEKLPPEVREDWYPKLWARWSELPADQSTSLLALLDKLY
jgi:tetratricopeptide (TPR) repeat protein